MKLKTIYGLILALIFSPVAYATEPAALLNPSPFSTIHDNHEAPSVDPFVAAPQQETSPFDTIQENRIREIVKEEISKVRANVASAGVWKSSKGWGSPVSSSGSSASRMITPIQSISSGTGYGSSGGSSYNRSFRGYGSSGGSSLSYSYGSSVPKWNVLSNGASAYNETAMRRHMSLNHGISTVGKTMEQLWREHDQYHDTYGAADPSRVGFSPTRSRQRVATPLRSTFNNCPGGVCPTTPRRSFPGFRLWRR